MWYKGTLTGRDTAIAAFVDGWLYLEGQRTTFSLHARGGQARWHDDRLRVDLEDDQSVEVWLAQGGVDSAPYFAYAAKLWAAERDDPGGEPVWPPFEVHPVVRTSLGSVLALATFGALPLGWLTPRSGIAALALALDLAFLVWTILGVAHQREADRRSAERDAAERALDAPRFPCERPVMLTPDRERA